MTTFLAIADNSKLSFVNFESKATGKLEKIVGKYMISEITLSPKLTLAIPDDEEKGLKVLQKSEAACLISNSVRSRIVFIPEIKIQHDLSNPPRATSGEPYSRSTNDNDFILSKSVEAY
jgi:organic hydroperoxide reductase OsmC/OhrA